jgi:dihydrofolate synthase / folylpolyglutamate synthase
VNPDSFFLSEWHARRPGEGRSLRRARELAEALGLLGHAPPVLSVVGSKGKGTTATYASACLAAAGKQVVTVTGPGYRRSRERIRRNGRAVDDATLLGLAKRLQDAVLKIPGRAAKGAPGHDGYLAPTGLFTLAGVLHARDVAADVIVLEAGMGGRSDEISLFPPAVAALTTIFAEHVGKLGDTPAEIAREKAAIVTPGTRAVLTVRQSADVRRAIEDTVRERSRDRLRVEVVLPGSTVVPRRLLHAGLTALGAELGCAAGGRLLGITGWVAASPAELATVLASVRLPGRLSRHRLPGSDTELIVDSASNRAAIAAALAIARSWWTGIDHVVVCLPDHKDVTGAITELAGLPVAFVRLPDDHLRFTHPLPGDWSVIDAASLTREVVAGLGRRVLALGTVYFAGLILDLADADTECLFQPRRSP